MNKERLNELEFFKNQKLNYAVDSLTQVLNREMILKYVNYLINNNIPFTVCLSDIDNFKTVNDNYGHMKGDEVLSIFAKEIEKTVGDEGVIGRYGGDEFMIVLEGITEYNDVWRICHKINMNIAKIKMPFSDIEITLTTGISRFPLDGKNYEEIISTADKALYRGKMKGRNCFIIYLAAKHSNIMLKTENEATYSSMDMHGKLFDILTKSDDPIKDKIDDLMDFFSSFFMYDHICIQNDEKVLKEMIHPLSKVQKFEFIKTDIIKPEINNTGLLYINNRKTLVQLRNRPFFDTLVKQDIISLFVAEIKCKEKLHGYLRIDMCDTGRIWQASEMDLLFTAAKLLAVLLDHTDQSLEDILVS